MRPKLEGDVAEGEAGCVFATMETWVCLYAESKAPAQNTRL